MARASATIRRPSRARPGPKCGTTALADEASPRCCAPSLDSESDDFADDALDALDAVASEFDFVGNALDADDDAHGCEWVEGDGEWSERELNAGPPYSARAHVA